MVEVQNGTLICSVVCLDVVDYSRKPVVEQIKLKDRFNTLLTEALRNVAVNDRIILDTGDGAAISFLGDPEDALFVATGLRDVIAAEPVADSPRLSVRIGINLGPLRLVKDINGQPNVIGDGINVAQRVMSFAEPGQVLVSRPYHEVVSRMSEETSRLFSYEGSRTDKHIREHEVYALGATVPAILKRPRSGETSAVTAGAGTLIPVLDRGAQTVTLIKNNLRRKPLLATWLTVIAILGVALVSRGYREQLSESVAARQADPAPAEKPGPVALRADRPPPRAKPQPSAPSASVRPDKKPALVGELEGPTPAEIPVTAAVGQPATISFAISPWGEVFIDRRSHGVSPPLREVQLTTGRHVVEIKNPGSPSHVETLDVNAGGRITIKHKFN